MGSRDRAPRKKRVECDAAIEHIESSLDEQRIEVLKLCSEDGAHALEG